MGWWKISLSGSGGFSLEDTESEGEDLYNGDGPADILGAALDEVIQDYQNSWGREPYKEELESAFKFVADGLELRPAPTKNV